MPAKTPSPNPNAREAPRHIAVSAVRADGFNVRPVRLGVVNVRYWPKADAQEKRRGNSAPGRWRALAGVSQSGVM
jgi:hypothetical protein